MPFYGTNDYKKRNDLKDLGAYLGWKDKKKKPKKVKRKENPPLIIPPDDYEMGG